MKTLAACLGFLALLPLSCSKPASSGDTKAELTNAALRQTVTQYGITWTFDKLARTGQFIACDWWAVGPVRVMKNGNLQEWADDLEQREDKHRHFSHMYGLYSGNVLSVKCTPELVNGIKAVLEQRGDGGTGWSRAWKTALYARLADGERAHSIYKGYLKDQCYVSLFVKCYTPLQVDGSLGMMAAITECLSNRTKKKLYYFRHYQPDGKRVHSRAFVSEEILKLTTRGKGKGGDRRCKV